MKKLFEIYYQEVGVTGLGEKIYPFESNQESKWDSPLELMEHLTSECGYPHGTIESDSGGFVTFEDGYTVKVTL